MLRVFVGIPLLVAAGLVVWLARGSAGQRADFVVASGALRTIDPHRVSWLDEIQVASALFEGLTRLEPRTMQPEPGVAERWDISPDRREYTFHLRRDACWSNGEPVLAAHFRFAWLRVLDPRLKSQYASLLFVIDGAERYYRSRLDRDPDNDAPAEGVAIRVLDERTLRVRLVAPCSYFLDLTAFATFAPVFPPALRDAPGGALESRWTRAANIVCNGPFVLRRWDFKRRLILERNPHYWDAGVSDVRRIEVFISTNPATSLLGYETGRIDLVRGLEPEIARVLLEDVRRGRRRDFHVGDRFATFFLRVNCRRQPTSDARFRKALSLAIDREALCEHVLGLGEVPALTFVPRTCLELMPRRTPDGRTVFYQPPEGLGAGLTREQRTALARRLLAESGWDDARPIELAVSADAPLVRRLAEAIQRMWEERLGLRVDLRVLERTVLSQRIRNLDYDVVRSDWYGDYLDPSTFLDMFTSTSGQNRTGWAHAGYDRLIATAAREPDDSRRFELLAEAERILCEQELPIIPIYHKRGNFLLRPGFAEVVDNVRDILPIQRVRRNRGVP